MKRFYALTVMLLSVSLIFGQVYLAEDFGDGTMPPAGWTLEGQTAQWSNSGSDNAGGIAPEAMLSWKQIDDFARLISPVIDLTGTSGVVLNFRHFLDNYGGGQYTIGCASRSGGSDWNVIWEVAPNADVGPEFSFYDIPAADAGASDFQFCFYLDGNMYNFDYWYIDDVKLFTPYALDIEMTMVDIPSYVEKYLPFFIGGKVTNIGTDVITSFDVTYTVDGADPQVTSFSDMNMAMGDSYDFTCDQGLSFSEDGSYEINVIASNINGGDDDDLTNNELMSNVGVVPFIPEKKVLGEEATGTWCTWCPRGTCFMDYMAETYPDTWIGVAVHNSDPMTLAVYDAAIPSIIPGFLGYPMGTVDRAKGWDPSEFEEGYNERINAISPATCEITNFSYDHATRTATFDVESEFVVDVSKELRFMAIIAEDSLAGTSSDWAQVNAYSGGGNGPMCGFEDLPSPVPASQMSYDHVAVAVLDTPYGTEGSLPDNILAGETHSYTYTYTLPAGADYYWTHFIGVLLDMETGEVLNCNTYPDEVTGVGEPAATIDVNLYPNPTTGILYITGVERANVSVYNTTGRRVAQYVDFSGNTIDISDNANGIYLVNIQTKDGIVTKKVTLNR